MTQTPTLTAEDFPKFVAEARGNSSYLRIIFHPDIHVYADANDSPRHSITL